MWFFSLLISLVWLFATYLIVEWDSDRWTWTISKIQNQFVKNTQQGELINTTQGRETPKKAVFK